MTRKGAGVSAWVSLVVNNIEQQKGALCKMPSLGNKRSISQSKGERFYGDSVVLYDTTIYFHFCRLQLIFEQTNSAAFWLQNCPKDYYEQKYLTLRHSYPFQ